MIPVMRSALDDPVASANRSWGVGAMVRQASGPGTNDPHDSRIR